MGKQINLRVIAYGEHHITVDAADYRAAAAAGRLRGFLGDELDRVATEIAVVEDDGTLYRPDSLREGPHPSLLGGNVTAAVAAILAAVPGQPDCTTGCTATGACVQHLAEAVVDEVRHQRLIVMPEADAERVLTLGIRKAVDDALAGPNARLAGIAKRTSACPAPDVANGVDTCRHGAWPCGPTLVSWLARGLDPDEESARVAAKWRSDFAAMDPGGHRG